MHEEVHAGNFWSALTADFAALDKPPCRCRVLPIDFAWNRRCQQPSVHQIWDAGCSADGVPASKSSWEMDTGGDCTMLSSSAGSSAGTAASPPDPHGRNSAPDSSSSVMAASTRFVTCARRSKTRLKCLRRHTQPHQATLCAPRVLAAERPTLPVPLDAVMRPL